MLRTDYCKQNPHNGVLPYRSPKDRTLFRRHARPQDLKQSIHKKMAKKILIIDDDPDILELLDIVFQDSGYEVVLSRSCLEPDQIQVIHPDVLLLDVQIAGCKKTGAELCRQLKADRQTTELPVILFSAIENLLELAEESLADNYVNKPFSIDNLLKKVALQLAN